MNSKNTDLQEEDLPSNLRMSNIIELDNDKNKVKLQHLPELDSLRTFAVVLVMLAHFLPLIGIALPFSWYGVDLFFTISGFLITTILINALKNHHYKKRIDIIKNFIVRRSFRLFPAYYLFLSIFWLLKNYFNVWIWQDIFTPYFFSYTPNWLIFKIGLNHVSCFSHLWSLGVEEQFYLFWPWLILFLKPKYHKRMIVLMIIVSLLCSYLYHDNNVHLLPFANFHTLGIGALLACFYTDNSLVIEWLKRNRILTAFILSVNLLLVLIFFKEEASIGFVYRALSLCLCTASLVIVSIYGWKGVLGGISKNKFIQYVGKISYGLYLYHMAMPALVALLLHKLHYSINNLVLFFTYFIITFLLASVSYKYIETPFLRLKKRFEN